MRLPNTLLWIWLSLMIIERSNAQNSPTCSRSFVTISEYENVAANTVLHDFEATPDCTDPDSGALTYNILSGDTNSRFTIIGSELQVGGTALDAEAITAGDYDSPFKLIIEVTDTDLLSAYVSVVVEILSINDNDPSIVLNAASVGITESTGVGTSVTSCALSDDDYPGTVDSSVEVSISAGNTDSLFAVNKDSCDLTVIGPLDYETTPSYSLTLEVTDLNTTDPRTATQVLTVNLLDENDVAPTCDFYETYLLLDEGLSGDITTLNCVDDDALPLVFTQASGTLLQDYRFKVNTTGTISMDAPGADYEAGDRTLLFAVLVTDQGNPINSVTVTYSIVIINVDDNIPVFNPNTYTPTITESAQMGDIVLTLTATDADEADSVEATITYGFETACSQDWFDLEAVSGYLVVKATPNTGTATTVTCQAFAYSSDLTASKDIADITVTITANNNPPAFTSTLYEGTVSESDISGTSILTVTATDTDSGNNGIVRYSLQTVSPFIIDEVSGQVDLDTSVDYETDDLYLVMVRATDQGSPALSTEVYLSIAVDPVNDFDPAITAVADQTVSEDSTPGTLITTITVSDSDSASTGDGQVELTLADPSLPFVLEPDTGALRVGLGLDRETTASYDVIVVATDKSGSSPRSSSTTVSVTVSDANDNAPSCSVLGPITVTPSTVNIGDIIGQLVCADGDSSAVLTYTETSGDTNNIFQVDAAIGEIRLVTAYVYGTYTYQVTVSDGGSPAETTIVPVEIQVEAALSFVGLPDTVEVAENLPLADIVYNVTAEGAYDLVTYSIVSGNAAGKFSIHPSLGQVRLVGELDRETTSSYTLTIRATSSNGQTLDETLTVTVSDINDNTPQFPNSFVNASITENVAVPLTLETLAATDLDLGNNAQIDYAIVSGNTGSAFTIDSSGNLILISPADYESTQYFDLIISATDRGSPALTGTTQVYVTVVNLNDNAIVVTPTSGTVSISVAEDTAVGDTAVQISASDDDIGTELDYVITSGNDFEYFSVNPNTGAVYVALPLDRETLAAYVLTIEMNSTAGETATVTLSITITDVNDNDPQFHLGNYVFEVAHGVTSGTNIGTLTVTDADATSPNSDYALSIESGDANGDLSFNGDILQAATTLDANTQNLYSLVVIAVDGGTPARTSTAYVTVHIAAEFQQPSFVPNSATISIEETRTTGSIIFDSDATASGGSEFAAGDLQYSIFSGNDEGKFYVEEFTGAVQLLQSLSYATTSSYTLVILAVNKYVPNTLTDFFTLTIDVTQVNKYDPVFSQDTYSWTISEDAATGTTVGTVLATDTDLGDYGTISYALEANSTFVVDGTSGIVTLQSSLEYSEAKSYNLYVTATDNAGNTSRTSSAVIVITVTDVNNHSPVFSGTPYNVSVPETLSTSSSIYVVHAEDLDSGAFGTVTYAITAGDTGGLFSIGSSTGVLSIVTSLDYETLTQHVLIIEANDGGTPSLTGTATLTVNVIDMNDNTPNFGATRLEYVVSTDQAALSTVTTLTATDTDTSGTDGTVNYVITSGNDAGLFSIDTVTGEIKTTQGLTGDEGFYTLTVVAVDQGVASLTGTVTVGISVQLVTTTPTGDYYFILNEVGDPVDIGTITKDASWTNPTYTITGGNYDTSFSIAADTAGNGILSSTKSTDREEYAYYQLTVEVNHDSGTQTLSVIVEITDDNDNTPVVSPNPITITMVENLPVGDSIGTITATDTDQPGRNTELSYTLSTGTPLGPAFFAVDSTTGEITIATQVNYEVFSYIEFEVLVRDNGKTVRTATATVEVTVVDVVEVVTYTAIETTYIIPVEFPHDLGHNEIVYTLSPSDFGVTLATGDVAAYLTSDYGVFNIDSSSGQMSLFLPERVREVTTIVEWVILSVKSGATTTSHAGLVRLDTFNKDKHLIAVVSSYDDTALAADRSTLETHLQTFYTSPNQIKIWKTEAITPVVLTRRRLLQTNSGSVALAVVVADSSTDTIALFDQFKTFLEQDAALAALRISSDGTPASNVSGQPVPVTSVLAFVSGEFPVPNDGESEDETLDGAVLALIIVAALAAVTVLLGSLLLMYWCCDCCVQRRSLWREDRRALIEDIKFNQRKRSFVGLEDAPVVVVDDTETDMKGEQSEEETETEKREEFCEEIETEKRESPALVEIHDGRKEITANTDFKDNDGAEIDGERVMTASPDYKTKFGGTVQNTGTAASVADSTHLNAPSSVSLELSSRASSVAELPRSPSPNGSLAEHIQDPLHTDGDRSGSNSSHGSRTRKISVSPAPQRHQIQEPTTGLSAYPSPLLKEPNHHPGGAPLATTDTAAYFVSTKGV